MPINMLVQNMKRWIIETTKSVLQKTNLPVGYGPSSGALARTESADAIRRELSADKPSFIARFGWTEINAIIAYTEGIERGVRYGWLTKHGIRRFVNNPRLLKESSGFFTNELESVIRFCRYQMDIMEEIDICVRWMKQERFIEKYMVNTVWVADRALFDPIVKEPWTSALKGKRVLVVSPFAKSIELQYGKKGRLFGNKDYLPEFNLQTYRPVQVISDTHTDFKSWWEALEFMKTAISELDFDVALLACGAFGHPLCAHIKSMGKKAVYMGGELQLMFGIYGDRWVGNPIINEHWIRPLKDDLPKEGAADSYKALANYL